MKFRTSRQFLSRLVSRRNARLLAASAGLGVFLAGAARQVSAATLFWDNDGASSAATGGVGTWTLNSGLQWRNGSSTGTLQTWTDSTGTADTADFAGTAGTVTLGSNLGALGLVFDTTNYTLATGTFTLSLGASGITQNVAAATISSGTGGLSLTANQSWAVASGGTLTVSAAVANNNTLTLAGAGGHTLSGVISGTGNLTKTSAGTLALSNANIYTGTTTLSAGTTNLTGSINASSAVNVNGGTLALNYAANTDKIGSGASLTLSRGGLVTMAGNTAAMTEAIGVLGIDSGSSQITITASNSSAQTLSATSFSRSNNATSIFIGSSLGQNGNSAFIKLGSTSGLTLVGTNAATGGATAKSLKIVPYLLGGTSGATPVVNNFVTYDTTNGFRTLTSADDDTLTVASTTSTSPVNAVAFSGTVTTTSDLTVNSLLFSTTTQTLNGSGGSFTINSGALAVVVTGVGEAITGFSKLNLGNGEGVVSVASGSTLTIASPVDVPGGGGLTIGNTGTVLLTASALYTGQTTINSGTLQLGNAGTVGSLGANTANIVDNGTLTVNRTDAFTLSNSISGLGGFTQAGTGTTTLSGTNTYAGTTAINAGGLQLGAAAGLSPNSTVTFNGSVNLNLGGFTATAGSLAAGATTTAFTATVTNGSLNLGANNFTFAPANTAGTTSTLDLSALTAFTYNQANAGQTFNAAVVGAVASSTQNATLNFANGATGNTVTATNFNVGSGGANIGGIGTLNLGNVNTINATNVTLGGFRSSGGTIQFNATAGETVGANALLTLRGLAGGNNPVSTLTIGTVSSGGGGQTGLLDTTGGSLDAIVNTTYISQIVTATPGSALAGTFRMQGGTFNAGTIYLGYTAANSVTATTNTVTFTQNAGAILADAVTFAQDAATTPGTNLRTVGVYNLGTTATTATLSAGAINLGTASATTSTSTLNFNNGTISNYDNTVAPFNGQGNANGSTTTNVQNLTIAGLTGGGASGDYRTLSIVLPSTGTHNFFAGSGSSITEASTALISGAGGLTINGPGTVTFQGANTYGGNTNVNTGTLIIAGAQTGSGQLIVNGSSVLQFGNGLAGGSSVNSGTIFVNDTGTVQVYKADGGTVTNQIASNPNAVTTLSGINLTGTTNTFTGTEFSNGGSFATNSTNVGATLAFTGASGTLNGDTFIQSIDTKGTSLPVGGAGNTLFSGSIYSSTNANAINVIKNGAGTLIYQYNQRYTGETDINAGTVRVDVAQTNSGTYFVGNGGASATMATLLLGGGADGLSGGVTFNRAVTINPGGMNNRTLGGTNTAGTNTFSSNIAMDGVPGEDRSVSLTAAGGGTVAFTGVISGAGQRITKVGTGIVTLSGANTFSGTTTVSAGTLTVASTTGKALGSTTSVAVNAGTLLFGQSNQVNASAPFSLGVVSTSTGSLTAAAGASQGSAATVSGGTPNGTTTQGLGALTLNNTATLTFNGLATTLVFNTFTPNGNVLTISGYNNTTFNSSTMTSGSGSDDRLVFLGDQSANFANFDFGAGAGAGVSQVALDGGFYELGFASPVPEPGTWAAGALLVGVAGWSFRRRTVRRAA